MLDGVLYFHFGKNKQLNNCFERFRCRLICLFGLTLAEW